MFYFCFTCAYRLNGLFFGNRLDRRDDTATSQNLKNLTLIKRNSPVGFCPFNVGRQRHWKKAKVQKFAEFQHISNRKKQWNSRSVTVVITGAQSSVQTVQRPASSPRKIVRARTRRTCLLQPIGSRRFDQVTRRSFPAGTRRPKWRRSPRSVGAASREEVGSIRAKR